MSEDSNETIMAWLFWIILIGGIWWWNSGDEASEYSTDSSYSSSYSEDRVYDRDDAIDNFWDEIRDYLSGSATVEACSDSGCYDLDADISSGVLDTIHFPNGGYIEIGDYISDSGYAYGQDSDGNNWDIKLDMDSYIVDDAIEEWASDNDYSID